MGFHKLFAHRVGPTLSLFLVCLAFQWSGRGTTVRPLDLPEMIQQAELVADVTVTGTESFWVSPAGGKAIHTQVTFSLNSAPLKGHVTSPFTLDFLGGTVGNHRMEISGMPKLRVGDRLIIFSYGPDKTFVSPLLGFDQGAIRVTRDQRNNVDRVYRWWGQPVNESEPFNSRVPISAATAVEQLQTANTVQEFLQRISRMIP